MKTFWICTLLFASIGVFFARAQVPDDYEDYYNYDSFEDLEKKIDEEINKLNEKTDIENDLKVEEEIQQFREAGEESVEPIDEPKEVIDSIADYQIEDNRDKFKEEDNDNKDIPSDKEDSLHEDDKIEESVKEPENSDYNTGNRPEDQNAAKESKDYALLWGDDSVAPLPVPEVPEEDENKAILEETQKILEEKDTDDFEEEIKKQIGFVDSKSDDQPNLEQIVEETKKLLEDNDESFNNDDTNDLTKNDNEMVDDSNNEGILDEAAIETNPDGSEEDTVDKVNEDLNADLDKLFAILEKLKDESSDTDNNVGDIKALEDADKFLDDTNDDYDNNNMEDSEELVEDNKDDIDLDNILKDILSEDDMKAEDTAAEDLELLINDALNEPNPNDDAHAFEEDIQSIVANEPLLELNDAFVDNEAKDKETVENNDETDNVNASVEKKVPTTLVDNLSSAEMDDLVSQFSILHSEDLDVHSESFNKNTAPVHLKLKLDEPTTITSPGHPDPYPTNNIVDWIIDGEGMGIELNITFFAVNGALGDYLLIKPGGVDDTGHEGLLFTYRLNSERRYRFMDVDRLFMRFESRPGMQFFRGFVISAKMIAPFPEPTEPIPEPEAVLAPPHSTFTLTFATRVHDFKKVRDEFQLILANMAREYIQDNNIDPGLNTTQEVTQITSVGLCPITWPDYEDCSAVTFGVSLVYEEDEDPRLTADDLEDMWLTYSIRDPYVLLLARMNLFVFQPPNPTVLVAWTLIASGVVVTMSLVAFVLWRYSCFEDYTRMKAYSDTDSLHNEKRNLDLYPTPHQTLPPLYAEQEYKWHEEDSTRVDMGGFANRSYARENMFDFESDEEVVSVTPRDRNGAGPAGTVSFSSNV